jgi:hypothetical protein
VRQCPQGSQSLTEHFNFIYVSETSSDAPEKGDNDENSQHNLEIEETFEK